MAKVEKRQKQEEDAAEKMKQAEMEYKAKIDVANQKQNKIKDETSNTARELQVDSPVKGRALYAKYAGTIKNLVFFDPICFLNLMQFKLLYTMVILNKA